MEGYSECHWPGGQLRVSTLNYMTELFQSPKGLIMVVIRLARGGSKGRPFFNIVVADKRTRRDGRPRPSDLLARCGCSGISYRGTPD